MSVKGAHNVMCCYMMNEVKQFKAALARNRVNIPDKKNSES